MATISITVPDEAVPRVKAAYQDINKNGPVLTTEQIIEQVKKEMIQVVKSRVQSYERMKAQQEIVVEELDITA